MNAASNKFRAQVLRMSMLTAVVNLNACKPAVLDPQGSVGVAEKTILINSLAIMLAIVVPTILATLGFAWWFRASNKKATHLPDWEFSGRIEMIVWSIPIMVVILLGGVAWIGAHALDPYKPLSSDTKPLEIQVISLDWKWLFIYPEQRIASVNLLKIPVATPVHFSLTSASVMSAFFVPQLGSMIYTMNGMVTQLNLEAAKPGTFYGLSSHYNGSGFSGMHFETHAVSNADFSAWAIAAQNTGGQLDTASYTALAQQSMNVTPFTYNAIDPELFQSIATQKLPSGSGPGVDPDNPGLAKEKE